MDIEVEIRDRQAGEIEYRDHTDCTPCGPDLSSFHPNQSYIFSPENVIFTPSTIAPIGAPLELDIKMPSSAWVHRRRCTWQDEKTWSNWRNQHREAHKNHFVLLCNDKSNKQCADVSLQLHRCQMCGEDVSWTKPIALGLPIAPSFIASFHRLTWYIHTSYQSRVFYIMQATIAISYPFFSSFLHPVYTHRKW